MREISPERTPLQQDYLAAYHAAKLIWFELRTDDEMYRIGDREEYMEAQVGASHPNIPISDIQWLGRLADQSVLDSFSVSSRL